MQVKDKEGHRSAIQPSSPGLPCVRRFSRKLKPIQKEAFPQGLSCVEHCSTRKL